MLESTYAPDEAQEMRQFSRRMAEAASMLDEALIDRGLSPETRTAVIAAYFRQFWHAAPQPELVNAVAKQAESLRRMADQIDDEIRERRGDEDDES